MPAAVRFGPCNGDPNAVEFFSHASFNHPTASCPRAAFARCSARFHRGGLTDDGQHRAQHRLFQRKTFPDTTGIQGPHLPWCQIYQPRLIHHLFIQRSFQGPQGPFLLESMHPWLIVSLLMKHQLQDSCKLSQIIFSIWNYYLLKVIMCL